MEGHTNDVLSVAFSADGRFVVSASRDKAVRVWDVDGGKEVQTMYDTMTEGQTGWVSTAAFSPDGRYVVSNDWYEIKCVWDTATGKLAGSHSSAGSAELTSLAICSVTGLAAVGNSAGSVRLLDLTNPAAITTIYRGRLHTGATAHVSFSPDGSVLASAGADGRLFFMDAAGAASFGMLGYYTLPALASCICWRVGQVSAAGGHSQCYYVLL